MDKGKCCQSKSHIFKLLLPCLVLLLSISCADLEQEAEGAAPVVTTQPQWFQGPAPYQWMELTGDIQLHPFYDMVPFSSAIDQSINFFPLFSSNSSAFRDFDMLSGKTFSRFPFCSREDIWKKRDGKLERPNFTYGVVPRLLDQLGMPQNIVVFGNESIYQQEVGENRFESHRVRVVGGVLHQYCEDYPCNSEDEWRSRLVLVAVDTSDSKFSKVRDWIGLKELVDWNYTKTFLENLYGGSVSGEMVKPSYRLAGEIDGARSLDSAVKKGHLFRFEDMSTFKKGCHKLYDYVWENVSLLLDQRDGKETSKPAFKDFAAFFSDFYTRYGNQYRTCVSRVHNGALNSNLKRFWFFAHFDGLFHLERQGYFFNCADGVWMRNPLDPSTGKYYYNTQKLYSKCTTRQFDKAFESVAFNSLGSGNSGNPHIRFIEYDHGAFGTHDRLYTWNSFTGKGYLCLQEKQKKSTIMESSKIDYFPKDIYWQRFAKEMKRGAVIGKSEFNIDDQASAEEKDKK